MDKHLFLCVHFFFFVSYSAKRRWMTYHVFLTIRVLWSFFVGVKRCEKGLRRFRNDLSSFKFKHFHAKSLWSLERFDDCVHPLCISYQRRLRLWSSLIWNENSAWRIGSVTFEKSDPPVVWNGLRHCRKSRGFFRTLNTKIVHVTEYRI